MLCGLYSASYCKASQRRENVRMKNHKEEKIHQLCCAGFIEKNPRVCGPAQFQLVSARVSCTRGEFSLSVGSGSRHLPQSRTPNAILGCPQSAVGLYDPQTHLRVVPTPFLLGGTARRPIPEAPGASQPAEVSLCASVCSFHSTDLVSSPGSLFGHMVHVSILTSTGSSLSPCAVLPRCGFQVLYPTRRFRYIV